MFSTSIKTSEIGDSIVSIVCVVLQDMCRTDRCKKIVSFCEIRYKSEIQLSTEVIQVKDQHSVSFNHLETSKPSDSIFIGYFPMIKVRSGLSPDLFSLLFCTQYRTSELC